MKILFFADKLPPEIGGMEVHAHYFIQHFYITDELIIISHNNGQDVLVNSKYKVIQPISIIDFISTFSEEKCVVFFNSGFWIEFFVQIKQLLKKAIFIYRTGGNEILKAPLTQNVPFHVWG